MEIREALTKAAEGGVPESLGSTPAPEPVETTATPEPETASGPDAPSPAASARARDEQGRFTTKPAEKPAAEKAAAAPKGGANGAATAAPPATEGKADAVAPPAAASAEPVKPPEPAVKAPQSWRPAAREKWAAVPPEVQAEVSRREGEIQRKLNEVAQTTKAAHEFQAAAQPWEALFRSQGISATQFLDIAARTQYTLTAGSPQQKAQVFAQLIHQSGVPIEVLDAALAGQPAQAHQQAVDPAHIAQQVEQRVQARFAQQAQQVAAERTRARLASFAESHEFYDSVRDRMADILAARAKSEASDKELEEVYDLACRIDPEVAGVMKQRDAAKAARTAQADTERTKAAASSVRSTPAAAPARTAQPKGIREALEAAADQTGFGR